MTSCDFSSSDYELSAFDIESIISAASQSTFEHSKNTFVYSDHTDMETKMCSKSAEPALLCNAFAFSGANCFPQAQSSHSISSPTFQHQRTEKKPLKSSKNLKHSTRVLKNWLQNHNRNPYPNKREKTLLAVEANLSITQISTWFANARRRLKKENKVTWNPRFRSNGIETSKICHPYNADQQDSHQYLMQNTIAITPEKESSIDNSLLPFSTVDQRSSISFNSCQIDDGTSNTSVFQAQTMAHFPDELSDTFDTMHIHNKANPIQTYDFNRTCIAFENAYNPSQSQYDQTSEENGQLHLCPQHIPPASCLTPHQTCTCLPKEDFFCLNRDFKDASPLMPCCSNIPTHGAGRDRAVQVLRSQSYCSKPTQHKPACSRDRSSSAGVYDSYGCKDLYFYQPLASENFQSASFNQFNY